MGSVPPKISLDFRPTFVPKTISDFLNEVSMVGNVSERASKLDDFVKRLEEEMKKIDAFKRELPFCMLLLNDAIIALKESSPQCAASNVKPVLEEFISLNKDPDQTNENEKEDCRDKKEWMSSVQLWKTDDCQNTQIKTMRDEGRNCRVADDRFQSCRNKNEERAFVAFKSYSGLPAMGAAKKQEKNEAPICALSLVTPSMKSPREELDSSVLRSSGNRATPTSAAKVQSNLRTVLPPQHQQQPQPARKQRRCWSPELHRRFVNALQQLGGSQVATPKQIRELMQVDGLTNDEVKSHLQKYRLHTRRLPSTPAAPADQSVIGLGDLWMSQDGYGESSKVSSSQSASPQGPLQLAGNGGYSTTGGDSVEDEEDAKSESYSYWKTHVHTGKR